MPTTVYFCNGIRMYIICFAVGAGAFMAVRIEWLAFSRSSATYIVVYGWDPSNRDT